MPQGYIAMERISLLPVFRGVKGAVGEKIFRYLCERARFQAGVVQIYGQDVCLILQPGQLWTRTRQIEKDIGVCKSTVAVWLRQLEAEGLIAMQVHPSTAAGAGFSVITVARHLLSGSGVGTSSSTSGSSGTPSLSTETPPPLSTGTDEKNPDLLKNSSLDMDEGEGEDQPGENSTQYASNEVGKEMPERLPGEGRYAYACRVNGWNVVKGGTDDERGSMGGSEKTTGMGDREGDAKAGTVVVDSGGAGTAAVFDLPHVPRGQAASADRPGGGNHRRARASYRTEDRATDRAAWEDIAGAAEPGSQSGSGSLDGAGRDSVGGSGDVGEMPQQAKGAAWET